MTKVLGLDVSSSCTGYCVVEDGYLLPDTLGTIKPVADSCLGQKLLYFEKKVKQIIKKHSPDVIVIEDIFCGPNMKTFKLLAMFRGVAFKAIQEKMGKDPMSVMPTEARKMTGVKGKTKEDAFEFIIKKYNFTDRSFKNFNDIADSIVLALSYFMPKIIITKKPKKDKK